MSNKGVVIIEDEFFAANHLCDFLDSKGYRVCKVYYSGEEFLQQTDWMFDAAIIDIFLSGEITGLEIAEKVKERQKPFILLTANQDSETLKCAARLSPQAYISKPFKENDISAALEIIYHRQATKIYIRGNKGVESFYSNEILYAKADGVYIEIHTTRGVILQRKLLKEFEVQLPENFIRVHRSYVVNREYIEHKTSNYLKVKEDLIPISKTYKNLI